MQNNNGNETEIDLVQMFRALWSNAIPILFVTLLIGALAFGYTFMFVSPSYNATATMYVNNSSFTFGSTSFSISTGELNAANTLVHVYTEILKSRTTLEEVIEESQVPYSYKKLEKMISVDSPSGTGIFSVTVSCSSPTDAELIANTIARVLPDRISEIVDGASVRIVDYAIVPAHRSSPSYIKNTAGGMIAGFLLCSGIVAVKNILVTQADTVIASSDDLKKYYPDIPLLAVIPDMTRIGKKGAYYSDYYARPKSEKKAFKKPEQKFGKEAK